MVTNTTISEIFSKTVPEIKSFAFLRTLPENECDYYRHFIVTFLGKQ